MAKQTGEDGNAQPIIIKRVKKGGHDAHHGGAWKVAYADFVTAMMAFFLLLWLLQATTEEQKLGIADYFSPASVSKNTSGSGGLMGGRTFTKQGDRPSDQTPVGVMIELPSSPPDWDATGDPEETVAAEAEGAGGVEQPVPENPAESDLEQFLVEREAEQFAAAEEALERAIEGIPELRELKEHLLVDQTPEGLRVQIVDQEGESMFPSGSAHMYDKTRKLLDLVADAVRRLPQQIAIKGHTDSTPFTGDDGYTNWELSTDRANASRRALMAAGLPPQRIASVVGLADTEPLAADDPAAAKNRRISIILLRETSHDTAGDALSRAQRAATP
jgi:chemotaxis protein MotB